MRPAAAVGGRAVADAAVATAAAVLPARRPAGVYYRRECLCRSLDGRRVELLTVTSSARQLAEREAPIGGCFPDGGERPHRFERKRVFFISARVHPGEVPASHVLHGLLAFLLRDGDPRAAALRDRFVFKFVPMLNPDGCARGHYRSDTLGLNLNRVYLTATPDRHPTIVAASAALRQLHERGELAFYIDCHGHATKRGCFLYGNGLPPERQLETVLYAKLVALNSRFFDFGGCVFYLKNNKKDKAGETKEGSGRVAVYKMTDMTYCYTLECNYNMGRVVNALPARHVPTGKDRIRNGAMSPEPPRPRGCAQVHARVVGDVGKALGLAALEPAAPTPPLASGRRAPGWRGCGRRLARGCGRRRANRRRAPPGSSRRLVRRGRRRRGGGGGGGGRRGRPAWRSSAWAERSEWSRRERERVAALAARRTHTLCRSAFTSYGMAYAVCARRSSRGGAQRSYRRICRSSAASAVFCDFSPVFSFWSCERRLCMFASVASLSACARCNAPSCCHHRRRRRLRRRQLLLRSDARVLLGPHARGHRLQLLRHCFEPLRRAALPTTTAAAPTRPLLRRGRLRRLRLSRRCVATRSARRSRARRRAPRLATGALCRRLHRRLLHRRLGRRLLLGRRHLLFGRRLLLFLLRCCCPCHSSHSSSASSSSISAGASSSASATDGSDGDDAFGDTCCVYPPSRSRR